MSRGDLFKWPIQNSQCVAALQNYTVKGIEPRLVKIINRYQLGWLDDSIKEHRTGKSCAEDVAELLNLAGAFFDAKNMNLYRGLALNEIPKNGAIYEEKSLSAWSLDPEKAFNLARVQRGNFHVIFTEKCSAREPGFYLDESEHELIRPPLKKTIIRIKQGDFMQYGRRHQLWKADLG